MAAKTANVLARIEPNIKEQAEAIMTQLGVPTSVVINMLYKQIIMTRSIPFSLSLPTAPLTREEMDNTAFNAMLQKGIDEADAGLGRPAEEVFETVRKAIGQ